MTSPLVVLGDAVLDVDVEGGAGPTDPGSPVPVVAVSGERVRPGGAALAAVLAARSAVGPVRLVTGLAGAAGRRLAELLDAEGIDVVDVGRSAPTPLTRWIVVDGRTLLRLDQDGVAAEILDPDRGVEGLRGAAAVLVSCGGQGVAADLGLRVALGALGPTPLVWDPHPRGEAPVAGATVVTPNVAEAVEAAGVGPGNDIRTAVTAAGHLRRLWDVKAVAVTLGAQGVLVIDRSGTPRRFPAVPVDRPLDVCGAGDAFAAAATVALAGRAPLRRAAEVGVAVARAFVASGGASAWRPTGEAGPPPRNARTRHVHRPGGAVADPLGAEAVGRWDDPALPLPSVAARPPTRSVQEARSHAPVRS